MAWQGANQSKGECGVLARPRPAMATAPRAAGRSFGIHDYKRPRGSGGIPSG